MTLGHDRVDQLPVPVKKSDVVRQMASLPGPGAGSGLGSTPGYVLGNNQDNAGRALEWFASDGAARGVVRRDRGSGGDRRRRARAACSSRRG